MAPQFRSQRPVLRIRVSPFAQDEIQVAEHPALASLREALLYLKAKPLTVEKESRPLSLLPG